MPKWFVSGLIALAAVLVGLIVYDRGVRKWLAPKPPANGGSSASSGMGGNW